MWGLLLARVALGQTLLDVNTATEAELDALPGIGVAKARALGVWRAEFGPCRELTDLAAVPGFGPATIAALRGRAICGEVAEANPRTATKRGEERDAERDLALDGPALETRAVDINRAGPYTLTELPGISLARANDIVAEREANGPFASCADLARLPGLGAATIELLADRCTASSE